MLIAKFLTDVFNIIITIIAVIIIIIIFRSLSSLPSWLLPVLPLNKGTLTPSFSNTIVITLESTAIILRKCNQYNALNNNTTFSYCLYNFFRRPPTYTMIKAFRIWQPTFLLRCLLISLMKRMIIESHMAIA